MRAYLRITSVLFGIIAIVHVLRLFRHWSVELAQYSIPLWVSWVALIIAGALSIWAVRLLRATGGTVSST